MSIGLRLSRLPDETWYQAAMRVAKKYGMETEVHDDYRYNIVAGQSEGDAAWGACYEWDILEPYSDDKEDDEQVQQRTGRLDWRGP